MRGFISVFAGLLATSGMVWAETCRVVDPTGTLNVHGEPNGQIVDTLTKGTIVSMSSVCDHCAASKMGEDCADTGKDRLGAPQLSAL